MGGLLLATKTRSGTADSAGGNEGDAVFCSSSWKLSSPFSPFVCVPDSQPTFAAGRPRQLSSACCCQRVLRFKDCHFRTLSVA